MPFSSGRQLALTGGILAGVTAFGDEQSHRVALFWSEYRLPSGRGWLVKITLHAALLVWLLFLAALPCLLRAEFGSNTRYDYGHTILSALFQSRLLEELRAGGLEVSPRTRRLWVCVRPSVRPLFPQDGRRLRRRSDAGGSGGRGLGAFAPGGGLRHWQVWLPAALVLFTGRFIMRPWTCDRVTDRGPAMRLAGAAIVTLVLFILAIGYRVEEVRDDPGGEDDVAFVASLPGYDENVGGREFRVAAERYARAAANLDRERVVDQGRRAANRGAAGIGRPCRLAE